MDIHKPNLNLGVKSILGKVGYISPKIFVFYNAHMPVEPMSKTISKLAQQYPSKLVFPVEFPYDHTPLGYSLEAYNSLVRHSQTMIQGKCVLNNFSIEENQKFGQVLSAFMRAAENDSDLTQLHEDGFLQARGVAAGREIESYLDKKLEKVAGDFRVKFLSMLEELRDMRNLPITEEIIIKDLTKRFPKSYFVTLHNCSITTDTYDCYLPDTSILSSSKMWGLNQNIAKKLHWSVSEHDYLTYVGQVIDICRFDKDTNYAVLELPQFTSGTRALPSTKLTKAILGEYCFPNPVLSECGETRYPSYYFRRAIETSYAETIKKYSDIGYFGTTPEPSYAERIKKYLDLVLSSDSDEVHSGENK